MGSSSGADSSAQCTGRDTWATTSLHALSPRGAEGLPAPVAPAAWTDFQNEWLGRLQAADSLAASQRAVDDFVRGWQRPRGDLWIPESARRLLS